MIKITAPIMPVPFPRPSGKGKRRFNPKRYTDFKELLAHFAKIAMHGLDPFQGEIAIRVNIFRPKPRPRKGQKPQISFIGDTDNYLKAVMDALIGICYVDDRQVTFCAGHKIFGEPHIEIELEETKC